MTVASVLVNVMNMTAGITNKSSFFRNHTSHESLLSRLQEVGATNIST